MAANPPITQSGDMVEVGRLPDDATRKAVSISYDITVPSAASVAARSGSGDLGVRDARRGASLSTGSGDIVASLKGSGSVNASTGSGDISVDGTPTGEWQVSSASGDVRITMPVDQGFTLDARTTSGSLEVRGQGVTVEKSPGRRHAAGAVRGGGPTLRLSTASGDIAVK